jgi:tetratricopeptide (TPR) repeat protein
LSTRMLVAAKSLVAYLWKMIVPLNLIPYYPYPNDASFFSLQYLSAIILAAAITTACIVMAKKQKLFLSVWMYYVVTLLPVLGIVQVGGQSMADRYTYLPGIGPFLLMGMLTAVVSGKLSAKEGRGQSAKFIRAIAAILVLLSLTTLTYRQIEIWENSFTLWTYVIEKEPARIAIAYNNRGLAFLSMGDIERAIEDCRRAVAQDPGYAEAHSNLGVALSKKGLLDDAIGEFQIAIRLSPEFANAHRNLAPALYKSGRIAEALEQYIIVTKLLPYDARAHADLGSVYGGTGSDDKAIEHFQIALRLRPDLADAHYNLAIAYLRKGFIDQAVEHLEAAARLDPADTSIRDDLARAYSLRTPAVRP